MKIDYQKTLLGISIISFTLFSYLFYFLYGEIKSNSAAEEEVNLIWQEESKLREEVSLLSREFDNTKDEREELEKHFADNSDLVPFLDTIEGLARQAGATAQTTSVDITPDGTSLSVGLDAEGTFEAVYKYLTLLENSPYELELYSVHMYKEAGGSSVWKARFGLKLISFTI